mmetsp:Transcript_46180/g.72260  ORF Transcript_46180/g.72260 Transcript_46180/m.72260 type:complete len:113 (-) Transcript_46180:162-500(-)
MIENTCRTEKGGDEQNKVSGHPSYASDVEETEKPAAAPREMLPHCARTTQLNWPRSLDPQLQLGLLPFEFCMLALLPNTFLGQPSACSSTQPLKGLAASSLLLLSFPQLSNF